MSLQPFRHADEGSGVFDILITGLEITQKMNLQHDLEVSTSRFRSVVDAAYDAIITIDQEHNITLFNRAAENLFGYDASEIIGQPLTGLLYFLSNAGIEAFLEFFAKLIPRVARQHGIERCREAVKRRS